ncbi:MAG TPA: hypothetical protein VF510_07100 [Ktedonobacterales bacterium]
MAERERAAVQVARRTSAISTPTRPDDPPSLGAFARTMVLLLLAICVVGVGPLLVVNGLFGTLHVNMPPVPGLSLFAPTATEATDLALPRQAWAAVRVNVMAHSGGSSQVATLEPGFPVTMTAHQKAGSTVWSRITWEGPTHASGGEGWAPDSAFVSYGGQGRPIGDVGALSPQLMATTAPYGSKFAAALYFPESGQLYRSRADQAFALGDGFRSVLLAAIFTWNEEPGRRVGTAVTASTAAGIARDDASAASFAYGAVGDQAGISAYLTRAGIAGIQPAQGDWQGAQATPNALLEFYTALARKQILNDTDRATVAALLGHVTSPLSTQMSAILSPGNGGFFVIGVAQGAGGWTMSVCAIIGLAHGSRMVVAAVVRDQPTQSAAEAGFVAFYRQLAKLMSAA